MRRYTIIFVVLVFLLASIIVSRSLRGGVNTVVDVTAVLSAPDVQKNAFSVGEKIAFGIYSNGLKTGRGELFYHGIEKSDDRFLQNVHFAASTFSVRDKEDVLGTSDFSFPVRVSRQVRVFGRDESIEETYAADHRSVVIRKTVNGKQAPERRIDADKDLGHVLLAIYRLRNDKEFAVGKAYEINLPTQQFKLIVKDKRMLKVPLGRFETFYLESEPAKYKIWLKTGSDRLPLRIQGLVAAGMLYLAAINVTTEPPSATPAS